MRDIIFLNLGGRLIAQSTEVQTSGPSGVERLAGNRLLAKHNSGLFGRFKVEELLHSSLDHSRREGSGEKPGQHAERRAWRHHDR